MFPNVGDRPLRILRTTSLILPLLTALTWGWITWNEARTEARERAVSNAALLKEYVQRLIQTEITVLTAADAYAAELANPAGDRGQLHEFLAKLESRSTRSAGIAQVTADGRFAATSRNYTPGLDVSDRAYYEAVRNGEQLYIDRIRTRPGNEDTLVVARRRNGEVFDGAFVSSIFVSALHPFLAQIAAESGEVAALINTDGVLLVRSVPGEAYVLPENSPMRAVLGSQAAGVFEMVAQVDGVQRVYAYRRLDELPLYVNFGVSRAGTAMKWIQDFAPKAIFLMALGLLGFAAASQAARRLDSERERMGAVFRQREAEKVADLKDTMLRELNHRVKNNLQSIDALIRLRLRREPNPVLEDVAQRVWAISEVHDLLYNSPDTQRVDLALFMEAISRNRAIVPPERGVVVTCDAEPVVVGIDRATPIALMIVEIVTNALKHAFPGREDGHIRLELRRTDGQGMITVADDGIGLPEETGRASGLRLVSGMLAQVGGSMSISRDGGTTFSIRFPLD